MRNKAPGNQVFITKNFIITSMLRSDSERVAKTVEDFTEISNGRFNVYDLLEGENLLLFKWGEEICCHDDNTIDLETLEQTFDEDEVQELINNGWLESDLTVWEEVIQDIINSPEGMIHYVNREMHTNHEHFRSVLEDALHQWTNHHESGPYRSNISLLQDQYRLIISRCLSLLDEMVHAEKSEIELERLLDER